jgi:hypothetical protein
MSGFSETKATPAALMQNFSRDSVKKWPNELEEDELLLDSD